MIEETCISKILSKDPTRCTAYQIQKEMHLSQFHSSSVLFVQTGSQPVVPLVVRFLQGKKIVLFIGQVL